MRRSPRPSRLPRRGARRAHRPRSGAGTKCAMPIVSTTPRAIAIAPNAGGPFVPCHDEVALRAERNLRMTRNSLRRDLLALGEVLTILRRSRRTTPECSFAPAAPRTTSATPRGSHSPDRSRQRAVFGHPSSTQLSSLTRTGDENVRPPSKDFASAMSRIFPGRRVARPRRGSR